MNCETAEECLLDYLEGQLDTTQADAMRSHIDDCPECRRALRETRELIDAIEHARRRQEQAWKQSSRTGSSAGDTRERARSFTFESGHLLGDFEIINEIGRGGMGVVYRARQMTLNRVVALKVLPASVCQTESAIGRFVREAQAAAKLHHTNIVPVYAQGESDGHFYYAMELIDGPNLGRLMKDDRSAILSGLDAVATSGVGSSSDISGISRMDGSAPRRRADYRRIAGLIASVADALEHAHRSNVIHRDIKPQNLLLGKDGEFHITDFGLARLLDEPNMTVTGEMLGTPAYMSPEQVDADRERIDARTDIYSLGVTLYELLTGKRPFEGTSREQVIARVRDREPAAPRKHDPNIPIDLDTICLRAMEKSPNRRYQTAEALAADLRRFAEDKPIHARRVSLFEKGIKWVRRHPAKFTIGVLVVLMIVGGVAWSIQAKAERRREANKTVAEAYEMLASNNYRLGDDARSKLAKVATMGPDEAPYLRTLGLSHVVERPSDAVQLLTQALEFEPDDTETMYILAWVSRKLVGEDECDRWIEKANNLGGPTSEYGYFFRALARVREHPDEAEADLESAISLRRSEPTKPPFAQAMLHFARAKNHKMYHTRNADDFGTIERMLEQACDQRADAYPLYLMSLANRIRGEIHLANHNVAEARKRFAAAMMNADDAIARGDDSARGFAALAEFWESVSDRSEPLGTFAGEEERARFHATHADRADKRIPSADRSTGAACRYCDWLGTAPSEELRRAVEVRNKVIHPGQNVPDQIDLLEYRWLDYYWLGDLDAARADVDKLSRLPLESDLKRIWYERLVPVLISFEQSGAAPDARTIEAIRQLHLGVNDYRSAVSTACLLHVLGDADGARRLLEEAKTRVDMAAGLGPSAPEEWWRRSWSVLAEPGYVMALEAADVQDVVRDAKSPPYFFQGCVALGVGDRREAEAFFRSCEACYDFEEFSLLARMLRRRMNADPAWPPWIGPAAQSED
ncbi:MAG: protein kinase [Phycisphaerales bacterium]|nr:protein kinase [Phycisphaerales bacterium]